MNSGPLDHLAQDLADLDARGLLRDRMAGDLDPNVLDLCSNDYLGYRAGGRLIQHACRAALEHPAGSGASRLVTGDHAVHRQLERVLADWVGTEESIVFTSGYAANVSMIQALAGEDDLIVSDALNHASIIDGCRLSRAEVVVVPHLALDDMRRALRQSTRRRRWVVTESYFSMDGDGPDLRALRTLCNEFGAALVVDEAHALGVMGPQGRGRAAEAGVRPDVFVGTLGKALAVQGAFVAGSRHLCHWLWNRARSMVFSTGLSPLLAAVALAAVGEARADDAGRSQVRATGCLLREGLARSGIAIASQAGPILPILLGSEARALAWKEGLAAHGVRVQAIRPPTVPTGTSRLRITARAGLPAHQMERVVEVFAGVANGWP
jgi:8-amino-7-oxononanoate synthase